MSDILIKGMEMPKNCTGCPICCGLPYQHRDAKGRRPNCPLVEIPTPHGRLIDADELIRELASEHVGGLDAIKKYTDADTWTSGLHTAWRLIDDASTVIEAEGSET